MSITKITNLSPIGYDIICGRPHHVQEVVQNRTDQGWLLNGELVTFKQDQYTVFAQGIVLYDTPTITKDEQ
jgi:hypothetical protein